MSRGVLEESYRLVKAQRDELVRALKAARGATEIIADHVIRLEREVETAETERDELARKLDNVEWAERTGYAMGTIDGGINYEALHEAREEAGGE